MNNYCVDEITNISCTLDTGCSVSIFPNIYKFETNSPVSWLNPNTNTSLRILGTINRTIKIGTKYYTGNFFVADINNIILGRDFIGKFFLPKE